MPSLSASRPRTRECGREIAGDDGRVHRGAEEAAPDTAGSGTIPAMAETSHGTVLVVDDEPTIVDVVARYLERAGYEALTAADGLAALRAAEQRDPDLIVLDVMLPQLDGIEVMRRLHERPGKPLPVILLTARGEESDRLAGLRRGADDYVVKPFSPKELVARVDAVLRRVSPPAEEAAAPIEVGPLRIDPAMRTVALDGEELSLTQREFDLLAYLAAHPGQVFSRDQLMEAVWDAPSFTDTSTVTVHVRRLRVKLGDGPSAPRFIETVWGVGYRLRP
jgi:two-component system response regulator ResD